MTVFLSIKQNLSYIWFLGPLALSKLLLPIIYLSIKQSQPCRMAKTFIVVTWSNGHSWASLKAFERIFIICLRIDYHPQFLRLTSKWRARGSQIWKYALPLYTFLKLRLHFVKIMDLVGLTCSVANHMGCSNYVATYADN